jgi:hypothetical protein
MHFIPHLTQILEIFFLGIGLDLIHGLDRLSLNISVFPLDLNVGNLDILLILILEMDDEFMNRLELVNFNGVINVA